MNLRSAFFAATMALGLGACTTAPLPTNTCMRGTQVTTPLGLLGSWQTTSNDDSCERARMAQTMMGTEDPGLRALATVMTIQNNPRDEAAAQAIAEVVATPNGKLLCTTRAPTPGSTDIPLGDCRLVMVQTQTAPSQSSAPAAAPQ